jgi:hypothetical protein
LTPLGTWEALFFCNIFELWNRWCCPDIQLLAFICGIARKSAHRCEREARRHVPIQSESLGLKDFALCPALQLSRYGAGALRRRELTRLAHRSNSLHSVSHKVSRETQSVLNWNLSLKEELDAPGNPYSCVASFEDSSRTRSLLAFVSLAAVWRGLPLESKNPSNWHSISIAFRRTFGGTSFSLASRRSPVIVALDEREVIVHPPVQS